MTDLGPDIAIATVLEVYPDTYTAKVSTVASYDGSFGKTLECKIYAMKITDYGAVSVSFPLPQDQVYVSTQFSESLPAIVGYVTSAREYTAPTEHQARLTPLQNKDTTLPSGVTNIRGKAPADALPGDEFQTGNDGQVLGMLTGGSLIAKASTLCQLLLTKTRATAILVARRFKIFTDFGEIISDSKNGTASLAIRGNSQVKKSNATQSYETEIQIGGEQALKAVLSNNFDLSVNHAGDTALDAAYLNVNIMQDSNTDILGDSNSNVFGEKSTTVYKDSHLHILGSQNQTVEASDTSLFLSSHLKTVTKKNTLINQSVYEEKTAGISLTSTSKDSKKVTVERGDYTINIGELGAIPAPITLPYLGSFNVSVLLGKINNEVTAGDINNSVTLGNVTNSTKIGKSSVEAVLGIAELTGLLSELNTEMRKLSGSGSNDPVVTALKLTQQITTKIINVFNFHNHVTPGGITPAPTTIPLQTMSPLAPNDVANDIFTLA